MNITMHLDRNLYGPAGARRHLWIRLEVPRKPARGQRSPLEIALVLDRSGSMGGEKIALARTAAREAVALLRESDRCALVAYDHEVLCPVPSAALTAQQRSRLNGALAALDARGNTDLFGGWVAGGEQVGAGSDGHIRRVILLTDGLANEGVTDHAEILHHVRELNLRGVGTSTFGVGVDFDEDLVAGMAEAGGGHFYYVQHPAQIRDYLSSELGELLTVSARSVVVGLQVSGQVSLACLNDVPARGALYDLGDLSEGAVTDLCFTLDVAPGNTSPIAIAAAVSWIDAESGEHSGINSEATLAPASDEAATAEPAHEETVAHTVRTRAARAREQALTRNKLGEYAEAQRLIEAEITEISSVAPDSSAVAEEVSRLREALFQFSAAIPNLAAKEMKYASYSARRSRPPVQDQQ